MSGSPGRWEILWSAEDGYRSKDEHMIKSQLADLSLTQVFTNPNKPIVWYLPTHPNYLFPY